MSEINKALRDLHVINVALQMHIAGRKDINLQKVEELLFNARKVLEAVREPEWTKGPS